MSMSRLIVQLKGGVFTYWNCLINALPFDQDWVWSCGLLAMFSERSVITVCCILAEKIALHEKKCLPWKKWWPERASPGRSLVKESPLGVSISCFFSGKLQALQSVTKDQRREYKSKFVDMDIEFQRMRERLENVHLILDDMQVM